MPTYFEQTISTQKELRLLTLLPPVWKKIRKSREKWEVFISSFTMSSFFGTIYLTYHYFNESITLVSLFLDSTIAIGAMFLLYLSLTRCFNHFIRKRPHVVQLIQEAQSYTTELVQWLKKDKKNQYELTEFIQKLAQTQAKETQFQLNRFIYYMAHQRFEIAIEYAGEIVSIFQQKQPTPNVVSDFLSHKDDYFRQNTIENTAEMEVGNFKKHL